jgi:hypothetical protein
MFFYTTPGGLASANFIFRRRAPGPGAAHSPMTAPKLP